MIQRLLNAIDAVNLAGAWIAALSAALLAIMLIVEVASTSFFNFSQPYSVEYSTYFQAAVLFAGSGWALRQGGHIRVGLLMKLLPQAAQRWLDALLSAFGLGLTGYIACYMVLQWQRTIFLGSVSSYPSGTPLAYPQFILVIGFCLLALAFLARLLRVCRGQPAEAAGAMPAAVE